MANATYTKLKSGNWGARSTSAVRDGDQIVIQKKSGEVETRRVEKVVWSGQGVWLCTLAPDSGGRGGYNSGRPTRSRRGGRYECEECGHYVEPGTSCWETGATH